MAQTSQTSLQSVVAGPSHSDSLYLKVFSGEVLKSFNKKVVWKGRHREKTIKHGKSAQFPAIGKAAAEYHTPGYWINGQAINHGEKVINVDDMLISSTFIANYEEAMNHYETRSEYAFQMSDALAQAYDQHLFALAAKACTAGTSGAVAEMGAATRVAVGAAPTITTIIDGIFDSAAYFDSTNIPESDRVVFLTPTVYWDIIQDGSMLDRDFGNDNGSQASGKVFKVAGMELIPSNNLALNFGTATLSGQRAGSATTEYDIDNTSAVALVAQKQALGTVKLMEMATEKEYQVGRQGTLMVSRYGCGHGVLRPECLRLLDAAAS